MTVLAEGFQAGDDALERRLLLGGVRPLDMMAVSGSAELQTGWFGLPLTEFS